MKNTYSFGTQGQIQTGAHNELQLTSSVGTRLGIDFDDSDVERMKKMIESTEAEEYALL